MAKRKASKKSEDAKKQTSEEVIPADFISEKNEVLAALSRKLQEQEFDSEEDMQSFLDDFAGRSFDSILAEDQLDETPQGLARRELAKISEGVSGATVRKHAKAALKHDPQSIEAWIEIARSYKQPSKSEEALRKAVKIGSELFANLIANPGQGLWGLMECRPFLTAYQDLAICLEFQGNVDQSIVIFEELLRLNPNDNQGARYDLGSCYLSLHDFDRNRELFAKFPDDESAYWLYDQALVEFLDALDNSGWKPDPEWDPNPGDVRNLPKKYFGKAHKLLEKALDRMPFVLFFLLDYRSAQTQPLASFAHGSPTEGMVYAESRCLDWLLPMLPGLWLMDHIPVMFESESLKKNLERYVDELEGLSDWVESVPPGQRFEGDEVILMFATVAEGLRSQAIDQGEDRHEGFGDPEVPVAQLKITLRGSKPAIWRRIQVPTNLPLSELHHAIQISMGWTNTHLYSFAKGKERFEAPNEWDDDIGVRSEDSSKITVGETLLTVKSKLKYTYDFGDNWVHDIVLEKVLKDDKAPVLAFPLCVKGAGNCPPEDCGGMWGFGELLNVIADPKHKNHKQMLKSFGEDYDPKAFDLEETNAVLEQVFRN